MWTSIWLWYLSPPLAATLTIKGKPRQALGANLQCRLIGSGGALLTQHIDLNPLRLDDLKQTGRYA